MSPSMNKRNTSITLCGALLGMSIFLSCDAQAEQTMTITIPMGTKIVETESSWCEPIYNESQNSVYVPRCWRLKQEPAAPNALERIISRATKDTAQTIENQLSNAAERQIYDMGQSMQNWLGTDK